MRMTRNAGGWKRYTPRACGSWRIDLSLIMELHLGKYNQLRMGIVAW